MLRELTRIISDLHFGDHASRIDRLAQLRPLLEGVSHLALNGDTLDTRPGPLPAHTAECRAEVMQFFPGGVPRASFLTGNHDADFSTLHHLDLGHGKVFVTHGDVFFDDIVPWSKDSAVLGRRIVEGLNAIPPSMHHHLETRLSLFRRVAASIPQRHQSERNKLKFALHYIADTVWPPTRVFRVMQAWQVAPRRAAEFAQRHRAEARFVICGHTHRPAIWRSGRGVTVINTGSFCPPLGAYAVDLSDDELVVRQVEFRSGEFRVAGTVAAFPLAGQ